MTRLKRPLSWLLFLLLSGSAGAAELGRDALMESIERAYNFEASVFDWYESAEFDRTEPIQAFVAATAAYWTYQADRVDASKRERVELRLSESIDRAEEWYKRDKSNVQARFFYGLNRCNRARFYVEESSWFKAYFDAREGLNVLRDLVKAQPDFVDAYFAIGVAECFLSDAPTLLKPLARLLGFRGAVQAGIEKLERCMDEGDWTIVEASYYLAYFYYSVAEDAPKAIAGFEALAMQYPANPLFAYFLGRSHQINHKPLDALEVYQRSRDIAYQSGAEDIGNWSSFRIGTILQGEHFYQDAMDEYLRLQKRLTAEMVEQEYFYLLPLKMGQCLIQLGDTERAKSYLEVVRPEWDRDAYREAQDLLKTLR